MRGLFAVRGGSVFLASGRQSLANIPAPAIDECSSNVPRRRMGRIKLDSLADFARHDYDARITCGACGAVTHMDPTDLAMKMHERGKSLRVEAAEAAMRCRAFGKRQAVIQPVERF